MVVGGRELIDTLWNVNDDVSAFIAVKHLRINRYIMECKLIISSAIRESSTELIDTLWNVN